MCIRDRVSDILEKNVSTNLDNIRRYHSSAKIEVLNKEKKKHGAEKKRQEKSLEGRKTTISCGTGEKGLWTFPQGFDRIKGTVEN